MKIIKSLEEAGIKIKSVNETIRNDVKYKVGTFLVILDDSVL